jgi:hypothetical protein
MQIKDNRKSIEAGDVIAFYPKGSARNPRYFQIMYDEARNRWLTQIMGDCNVYHREFNHPNHIVNHFNKHFLPIGEIEIIKKSQVRVVFQ